MNITIYAKKRTNKEGKPFTTYLSTLTRKDGTEQKVQVRFREDCGSPKAEQCPMNIVVDKANANVATETYTDKEGEVCTSFTLWISEWTEGEPFVDHSLDEFV